MQSEKEVVGTLRGFDEYVNMVLDDVTEIEYTASGRKEVSQSVSQVTLTIVCTLTFVFVCVFVCDRVL